MKYFLFLFCAISLFTTKYTAQTDSSKTKKWARELGLNIYGLSINGGDYYTNYKTTANNYACSGLNVKFYNKRNVIRTSFDYLQQIIVNSRFFNLQNNLISSKGIQLSVGYQRMLSKKSTSLFVFTDISYKHANELRNIPSSYASWDYYYRNQLTLVTSSVYSVSQGIGIRIKLRKNLLLTLESATQFYYSKENRYLMEGINIKAMNGSIGFKF
ncbi:MAG: hypothetical protein ABIP51_18180 [Bacteroidia bacterium]